MKARKPHIYSRQAPQTLVLAYIPNILLMKLHRKRLVALVRNSLPLALLGCSEPISSTADPSRQTKFPPPTSTPSSSSFTWRLGDDEEENVIRFQEPVVHDPTIVSDQQDGQVEIKWDTERKRRRVYFSQAEEGSEKSNFRLYNQSEIDFGS